ncbi:hypothetical protein, partial [Aestuariivirga sp.]|uniref:hypothetical protein n=1 Tax=Aestuariivirga sp. TaxID=2650926 RepID=UPI003783365A
QGLQIASWQTNWFKSMTLLDEAGTSLLRVQEIDASGLVRRNELGADLHFEAAEPLVRRTVELFKQIPEDHLAILPDNQLQVIKNASDSFFNFITQTLEFKTTVPNASAIRETLIGQFGSTYASYFSDLHQIISYISSRQKDYGALEREARAKIQQASDKANELSRALESHEVEAKRVLEEIKKVAAEQGVSQQAYYFKTEGDDHLKKAKIWENRIITLSLVSVAYLILAIFAHKLPYISPQNTYEAIQLSVSKSLIFAVGAYLIILCGKNFLSHQHNAVVNRHRQNALLTFKALSDAAGTAENRDIVLTHAASCIFSPQETGYTKGSQQTNVTGLIESIPRLLQNPGQNA